MLLMLPPKRLLVYRIVKIVRFRQGLVSLRSVIAAFVLVKICRLAS